MLKREHFLKKSLYLFCLGILIFNSCTNKTEQKNTRMQVPIAEKIKKELTVHGDTRIDNYYWLNDRENPKVIDYLKSENAYTEQKLGHTKDFKNKLYEEMIARIVQKDASVPYFFNDYFYYTRYEEGQEYAIHCRKKDNLNAKEEIFLDENQLAKGHNYYHISKLKISPDNKILAFSEDTLSRRKYNIRFKNLETAEFLKDEIKLTDGNLEWANDSKTLFYTTQDELTLRSDKIFRHILNEEKDIEIFNETDETFYTYITKSKSQKYLKIVSTSTMTSECRILDADKPMENFKVFQTRERGLRYSIADYNDKFLVKTNLDAKNFRLMETAKNQTSKENWKEIISHRDDVLLQSIDVFKNYLVVNERKNGLNNLRIINTKTKKEHYLKFEEEAYLASTSVNKIFDTKTLRYTYTSMTTPNSTYEYDMESKEKKLLKQSKVLGNFNKENYETKRFYATAKDKTKIPVSIVYKKGIKLNGKNPLLLYAYGSYGSSTEAYFSSTRLSLLDRGFIFAIAHVRGGQEMGRYWYEEGKLLNKKNTFTDFNDCAEFLIQKKYTNPEKLFALGGSAGGLLMGAIINMRPDLYKGVIAAVPFVDVVTTMLDESIPLTTGEFDEWGNPKNKEYYDYILSYSPYDQVKAQNYPNLLVTTGLHDSQVQYWEPAKWVAKLRELKTDNNLLLLQTNMEAGHGGASGRFKRLEEVAFEYSFFLDLAGVKE